MWNMTRGAAAGLAVVGLAAGLAAGRQARAQDGEPLAAEPVRDAAGNAIGGFDTWVTNQHTPSKSSREPQGWTAMHNGILGKSPVVEVAGKRGRAVKGTVMRVRSGKGTLLLRPDLSAGSYVASDRGINNGGGIPVSKRYAWITGYYKFAPRGGDQITLMVDMRRGGRQIAMGGGTTNRRSGGWTRFKLPIVWLTQEQPDHCHLLIQIIGPKDKRGYPKNPHPGSTMVVDGLMWADR